MSFKSKMAHSNNDTGFISCAENMTERKHGRVGLRAKQVDAAMADVSSNYHRWTCDCGNTVPSSKSRCSKCYHWREGKRKGLKKMKDSGTVHGDKIIEDESSNDQHWRCDCGDIHPSSKSRCLKCYRWRGGKRKGWKCKEKTGWSCCGSVAPGKKTQCAKCKGQRRRGKVRVKKSLRGVTRIVAPRGRNNEKTLIAALPSLPPAAPIMDHTYTSNSISASSPSTYKWGGLLGR